jgi:hypothetical protein
MALKPARSSAAKPRSTAAPAKRFPGASPLLNGHGHRTFCDDTMEMRATTPAFTGALHPEYLCAFDAPGAPGRAR